LKFKEKPDTCVGLDVKKGSSIHKRQRICDKCLKTIVNLCKSSGESEMTTQLKEKSHITGKKNEKIQNCYGSSKELVNYENPTTA
jgi:hypothetical protein